MFPIVRPWTIQPPPGFARSADGVFASLVFGVVGDGPELISGTPPKRLGGGNFGASAEGVAVKSASNTADGVYYVLPATHPLYLLGAAFTIFQIAQINSWGAYSSLFMTPYYSGAWGSPYGSMGLQRDASNNRLRLFGSGFDNPNTIAVSSGGRYVVTAARYSGGCRWLINGAYENSTSGAGRTSAPDFYTKNPPVLLNHSSSDAGEGVTGNTPITLIFNRTLTEAEMRWLAENYWQVAQPRRILLPSSAGSGTTISVPSGVLTLTGFAPTVSATDNQTIAVPAGALTLAGFAPTVNVGANQTISVPAGSLTMTGFAPTVNVGVNQNIAVPAGSLILTGFAPTISTSANQTIAVPVGSLTLTGFAPTVVQTAHQTISVPLGTLVMAGYAPTVSASGSYTISVPLGALVLTGYAPVVNNSGASATVTVKLGSWIRYKILT